MFGASFGIIGQALEIYKKSLDVFNRNVINANDPDYVEEEPSLMSGIPTGIELRDVLRRQNIYYVSLRNDKISLVTYLDERKSALENVEGIFQELFEGTGVNDYTNRVMKAYEDLMKNPSNVGAREELYKAVNTLSDFIKRRSPSLDRIDTSADLSIRESVRKINELNRKIYSINREITVLYAQTYARGKDYKNLLDTRDKYLRELSELINIDVQQDEIGRVKVQTSKGFVLVDYQDNYWQLEYTGGTLYWKSKDGNNVNITNVIESGKVKAMLDTRADLARFKSELNDIATFFISNLKIPRENSQTWYLIKNVADPNQPLGSTYGIDGNLTFYDNSTSPPTTLGTINNYGNLTLNGLVSAVNSIAGFSATLVNNPDGTYSIRIDTTNPNYSVSDSGENIFESSPVFSGTGLADISPASTLKSDMEDIDASLADTFSSFATDWWDSARSTVATLINDISTTQADVRDKLRIESALLESIDRKLQEMQGVSIDSQFMEIMKVQRTYEAVAKIVTRIDELLQTTINM